MNKLAIVLTAILMGCPFNGTHQLEPIPLDQALYSPPLQYQALADQALHCAKEVYATSENPDFKIVRDTIDVNDIVWVVVATERTDGGFPCRIEGKLSSCAGETSVDPDTIRVSSRYMYSPWVVRHEILHIIVDKGAAEYGKTHGVPWGLCEFF